MAGKTRRKSTLTCGFLVPGHSCPQSAQQFLSEWLRTLRAVARPRHQRKDIERVLAEAESHGWRFEPGRRYWRAYCPCGLHLRSVHLTPSDPNYVTNLAHWFRRTCGWPKEDG